MRPWSVPVRLELDGRACIVQSRTIQFNLPELWLKSRRIITRYGHMPMASLALRHSPGSKRALLILFRYLSEVDGPVHVSTAIANGLETALRRSRTPHTEAALSLTHIFISLAELFDPRALGCNSKIFNQMESFFLTHSEEILTNYNITIGFQFIALLDRMSFNSRTRPWDMTPVLACLVRAWDHMGIRPSTARHLPPLSSTSKRILKELALQANHARRRHRHQISSQLLACSCDNIRGRPALTHRPHSHHGDFRPSAATVPGQAFHPEDLLQFCLDYPELVDIRIPESGIRFPHNDGFGLLEDEMSMRGGEKVIFLEEGDPYGVLEPGMYEYPDPDEHLGLPWLEPSFVPHRGRRPRLIDRCR